MHSSVKIAGEVNFIEGKYYILCITEIYSSDSEVHSNDITSGKYSIIALNKYMSGDKHTYQY